MKRIYAILLSTSLLAIACGGDKTGSSTDSVSAAKTSASSSAPRKTILFFGDSLTAGYGLDDVSQSFPSQVQLKIDSANLPYNVVNGGVSGETSAGGNARIDWLLKQPVDVFVLELGANDGLRGLPVNATQANLQSIVDKVKAKYPKAKLVLLGMQVPPNMGAAYVNNFKDMFPNLAKKNHMTLVSFLLQGVGGVRKLNQGDGIHPTAEGAKILANNVWAELQDVLKD